jgi:hypothetical protein
VQENRNREILYMYRKMRATCDYTSLSDMCNDMCDRPASRYYLSEERARNILLQYERTGRVLCKSPYKRRLYESFIKECMRQRGTLMIDKVRHALDVMAPCLGVSPSRIHTVLTKLGAK